MEVREEGTRRVMRGKNGKTEEGERDGTGVGRRGEEGREEREGRREERLGEAEEMKERRERG